MMKLKKTLSFCVAMLLIVSVLSVSFAFSTKGESDEGESDLSEEKSTLEDSSLDEEMYVEDDGTGPVRDPIEPYTTGDPIRIDSDGDFDEKAGEEGWDGDGSEDDPYIIEGYEIDAGGRHGAGIFIGNTTVHFVIQDSVIRRSSSQPADYHPGGGIVYHEVENGTVKDVEIHTSDYGLHLENIEDNDFEEIRINSIREDGVLLVDSDNNTFEGGNIYTTSENGFRFEGDCKSNNLVDMTITNNAGSGVYLDGNGNLEANEFVDLTIGGNTDHGIHIPGVFEDNLIEGCRISSNGGDGILLGSSDIRENEIEDNLLHHNEGNGLRFQDGPEDNDISDNTIEDNEGYAIYFDSEDGLSNHFSENRLNGVEYVHLYDQDNETLTIEEDYDFESHQTLTNYGGVVIYESENISVEDMNIGTLDSRGITVSSSENVTLEDFEIKDCMEEGILVEDSEHITLNEFVITNVTEEGILVEDSEHIYLDDIEVSDSSEGISIDALEQVYLTEVSVENSDGLAISITAERNVILNHIGVRNSGDIGISIEALEEVGLGHITVENSEGSAISLGVLELLDTLERVTLMDIEVNQGISIEDSEDVELKDVEVKDVDDQGISIEDSEDVELTGFHVRGSSGSGIYLDNIDGLKLEDGISIENERGVELVDSNSGELEDVRARENDIGVYLEGSTNLIISDNELTSNREGIRLIDSEMNEIRGSDFIANREHGIHLSGASSLTTIRENYISSNHQDGIHLTGEANSCTIEDNVISNNRRYGLYIETDSNSISDNDITHNVDHGVYITGSSSSIFNNIFRFNNDSNLTYDEGAVQAFDDGSANTWYDVAEYGNYWWDWMEKYDPAEDDFVDAEVIHEPYLIDGDAGSEDIYPLYDDIDDYELYELTIEVEKEGSTHPEEGTISYLEGERVTVEAEPAHGYVFSNWTGDVPGGEQEDAVVTVEMDEDKTITANFERDEFDLTIEIEGEGETDPEEGTHTYLFEDEVNITAMPDDGWHISDWAGDVEVGEEEEITVIMEEDKHVIVTFERNEYDLTIDIVGEGSTEPEEGTHTYLYEEEVPVTAEAEYGWAFINWTGDIEREEEEITVVMEEDLHLIANFERGEFDLTIEIEGEGSTEPEEGTHTHTYEDELNVTASPDPGWYFVNWTGDIESEEEEITILMDENIVITANFKVIDGPTLDIEEGEGNGTVKIDGVEVDELPYERQFPDGAEAELEAVPDQGWSFSNWTGDLYEHALEFDGDGDMIDCGDDESLKFDDDSMSISTWVKPNDTEEHMGIGGKLHYDFDFNFIGEDDHFYYGYSLSMNNHRFRFQIGDGTNGGTERVVSEDTFEEDNEWYHVAGVHDGYNFYLYVNGELQGGVEDHPVADFDDDFVIGRQYSPDSDVEELDGPHWWDGEINDVRVYDRDLSEREIEDLYESDYEAIGPEVAWWSMNEGLGDIAYDQTPNENHGNIIGADWTDYPIEAVPEEVITVTMTENKSITVNFVEDEYSRLNLEKKGEGEIYVDEEPIDFPYEGEFKEGTEVDLKASPEEGWYFGNWTGDLYENSLEFDGTGDMVNCGDNETLKFDNESMSISSWVRPNDVEEHQGIAGKLTYEFETVTPGPIVPDLDNYYGYSLSLNNGRFLFEIGNGTDEGIERIVSEDTFEEDEWYHVAGVHDGHNFYLYVNGELQGEVEDHRITDFDDDFVIGRKYTPESDLEELEGFEGPHWWDGEINDVRVYDRDLSEPEIEMLYESKYIELGNEAAWWPMNEGEGDTIYDQSANENHGDILRARWREYPIESFPREEISIIMDEDKSLTANFVGSVELDVDIDKGEGDIYVDDELVEVPFTGEFGEGSKVEVKAESAEHWRFDQWIGDVPEEDKESERIILTMDENRSIAAQFEAIEYYLLDIDVEGEGRTDPAEGEHVYQEGEEVTITATPDQGWYFVEWTGDHQGTDEEITITMDENKSITAWFDIHEYVLDVSVVGEGNVEIDPEEEEYEHGTEVELTATPAEDWRFVEWTGDEIGTDPTLDFTMDEDKRITAHFEEIPTYTLSVDIEGEGEVEVDPDQEEYEEGTEVELTATPEEGWYFVNWTGDHESEEDEIIIIMDDDKEITAVFEEERAEFVITDFEVDPTEGEIPLEVTITAEIENVGDTEGTIDLETDGVEINNWTLGPDENVTVDETYTYEEEGEYDVILGEETIEVVAGDIETFELTINAEEGGTTDPAPETYTHEEGAEVTVEAIPDEGYVFAEWTGDYEGEEEEITVTMDEDKEITAHFEAEEYELTIDIEGEGTTDPEAGTHTYDYEEEVTVTADADEGWEFDEWTGDYEGEDEEITITMDEDKEITAHFEEVPEAEFEVTNFDVDVTEGEAPLEVTITADVENVGDVDGTLDLTVDGDVVESITLGPGESGEFEHTETFSDPGTYTIEFGDQSETVNVEEEEPDDDWLLMAMIGLIVLLVVIIGMNMPTEEKTKKPTLEEKETSEEEEESEEESEEEKEKYEEESLEEESEEEESFEEELDEVLE